MKAIDDAQNRLAIRSRVMTMCIHGQECAKCRFGCTARIAELLQAENARLKEQLKVQDEAIRTAIESCKRVRQCNPIVNMGFLPLQRILEQALKGE